MADRPQLPSVIQKIRVQPYLSITHFPNHQAWTSSLQNIPSAGGYAIDRLHKTLLPANAGSASNLASPLLPVFVRAPLEKHKSDSRTGLIYGSFLALFGVLTAPIGRVKLLIQCQDEMIKSGRLTKPYKGIVNCFARTISNEGFISLWRGYIPGVISDVSNRVISFGFNNSKNKDGLAGGIFPNLATHFVVYPLVYAQTRLANDIKTSNKIEERQFKGLIDVYKKAIRSDGIAGLYRGFAISSCKSFLSNGVYLGIQVMLRRLGSQDDFLAAPVMAVGVAVCQKMATYPLDTVSRRMMMTSGEVVKYQSSIHAFAEIIRNEGVKSLYKGGGTCILEKITLSVFFAVFITRLPHYFSTKKSNSAADGVSAKRNGSAGGDQSASTLTIKWTYGKKD
ncbi:ADP,ATP carrier protein-like isoform X1 [Quercus lobata]|uniref:ADP,ATP carrier protein-like isoform X1 n=1 Tax=Quercus lobata TaxID=97700 RepID=UPI0012456FB4|nr:ADP,ATP carrier protein-like isoform X1 [Quercus lobata]XP_030960469.1 ADP,ATP carrier protein-like isoform X1 [Quercus lobata]XP_030960470.1 ADP,ATP carrier protein-like isoform X1 [Quercus lobata]